jgi:hypothetical protein
MNIKLLFAFLLTVVVAAPFAHSTERLKVGSRGKTVPLNEITTLTSNPGETDRDFIVRTGTWLRNFTVSGGYEGCSNICRAPDGRLGAILATNNSHFACSLTSRCPEGFTLTGDSIHSHPASYANIRFNEADIAYMSDVAPSRQVLMNQRMRVDARRFSDPDIESGPGYLVTDTNILYQKGPRTTRVFAELPPLDPDVIPSE